MRSALPRCRVPGYTESENCIEHAKTGPGTNPPLSDLGGRLPAKGITSNGFVILNAARTGSHYLCASLDSHPEVLCHHEIFSPHGVELAQQLRDTRFVLGSKEERGRDPLRFLAKIWQNPLGRRCVGFNLCWAQETTAYRAVVDDQRIRKIVLKRRNRVKTFVSLALARETGQWVIYTKSTQAVHHKKIHIDPTSLLANVSFNQQYYSVLDRDLARTMQPHLVVEYEDLVLPSTLRRILAFIGTADSEPSLLRVRTKKLAPLCLREVIANFSEVERVLEGTDLISELYSIGW